MEASGIFSLFLVFLFLYLEVASGVMRVVGGCVYGTVRMKLSSSVRRTEIVDIGDGKKAVVATGLCNQSQNC